MNLRPTATEDPDVSVTPLIDVVLLLLIFFMVTTSFVRQTEIRLRLPEADSAVAVIQEEGIDVTITAEGNYLINGREVINRRPETLRRAMERVAGDDRSMQVVVRADARASHQSVVTAMDVAGRLGFVKINIATIEQGSGGE